MPPRTFDQVQSIKAKLEKNADYWQQRYERLENATHLSARKYVEELDKQYKLANKAIKAKLASFYAQFAESEGITLAAAKKLLDNDELSEFHMSVEEYIKMGEGPNNMDPEVQRKLERASIKYRVTRLEAVETELAAELEQLRLKGDDIAYSAVGNAYRERYYRSIYEIQKGIGIGSTFSKVDEAKLKTIINESWVADGLNFSDRIWKNKNSLQNELTNSLSQALILGQGYAETSEKFEKRMGVSFSNAARLIVTESAYYASTAQQESFNELGVDKYEIVATLDHVTSEICRHMDGQIFKMNDFKAGVTAPPFHPSCRTSTCPYFNDYDLGVYVEGERAARNSAEGETYYVPAGLDYDEWYRIYVLGKDSEVTGSLKVYSESDQKNILDRVKKAPPLVRRVYNKCVEVLQVADPDFRGEISYYAAPVRGEKDPGLHVDMVRARNGSGANTPYQLKFHEDGHNIDHILNSVFGTGDMTVGFSETYKDGIFSKTVEKEARENIERFAKENKIFLYSKEEATERAISSVKSQLRIGLIDEDEVAEMIESLTEKHSQELDMKKATKAFCLNLMKEIPNKRDRGDISDMFEVYTYQHEIYFPLGVGHGLTELNAGGYVPYFEVHDHGVEAFAEIFSAMATNEGSLKNIIKYFPESYDLMVEMLGVV